MIASNNRHKIVPRIIPQEVHDANVAFLLSGRGRKQRPQPVKIAFEEWPISPGEGEIPPGDLPGDLPKISRKPPENGRSSPQKRVSARKKRKPSSGNPSGSSSRMTTKVDRSSTELGGDLPKTGDKKPSPGRSPGEFQSVIPGVLMASTGDREIFSQTYAHEELHVCRDTGTVEDACVNVQGEKFAFPLPISRFCTTGVAESALCLDAPVLCHVFETGEESRLIYFDPSTHSQPETLNNRGAVAVLGVAARELDTICGVGVNARLKYETLPYSYYESPRLVIDTVRRTATWSNRCLPELPPDPTDLPWTEEDYDWAIRTLLGPLLGCTGEDAVAMHFLDHLALHWQERAVQALTRGRVADVMICGKPATGKTSMVSLLGKMFPAVYDQATDASLEGDAKGNDWIFEHSLLIFDENVGSKRQADHEAFKRFCDSKTWRRRRMYHGEEMVPRKGLALRFCNQVNLTVDESTVRKIDFYRSGESQCNEQGAPLDPEKSHRLESILQTTGFVLWFRELLATRDVAESVWDHNGGFGSEKLYAVDSSKLAEFCLAVERGERPLVTVKGKEENYAPGRGFSVEDFNRTVRLPGNAAVFRETGERIGQHVKELIRRGQLRWEPVRKQSGRGHITGYRILELSPGNLFDTCCADGASSVD